MQQFLSVASAPGCIPSATVICLNKDRFSVKIDWRTADGNSGQGQGIKYTPDSGLFWFFGSDNIEVLVKVLDACVFSRYWVFSAATTNVEYTLTVTDTKNGAIKTYHNNQGVSAAAVTDTNAFATCP